MDKEIYKKVCSEIGHNYYTVLPDDVACVGMTQIFCEKCGDVVNIANRYEVITVGGDFALKWVENPVPQT